LLTHAGNPGECDSGTAIRSFQSVLAGLTQTFYNEKALWNTGSFRAERQASDDLIIPRWRSGSEGCWNMNPEQSDPVRRLQRLERRLEIFGKICRHDLPNQLVAIRGLVNLLLEESTNFSVEGREYTSRLLGAAERALDMMQAIKTLLAVDTLADKIEEIDLHDLAQELAREIKQLFPKARIEYHFSIKIPKVLGARRTLHKAMGELLRHGLAGQAKSVVEISAQAKENAVEIALAMGPDRIPLDPPLLASRGNTKTLENRLELQVVRELMESGGGSFRFLEIPGKGMIYFLGIPDSQTASV
jgi:light-regulated signal transduction histidine kinase (bacteriophytochrome)